MSDTNTIKYKIYSNNKRSQTLTVGYDIGGELYTVDVPYPIVNGIFIENPEGRDNYFLHYAPTPEVLPPISEELMEKVDSLVAPVPDNQVDESDILKSKEDMTISLNEQVNGLLAILTNKYPEYELFTFDIQVEDARALLKDEDAEAPMVRGIAKERSMNPVDLARKVMDKHNKYVDISSKILGRKDVIQQQIEDAETADQLVNINTNIDISDIDF